MSSGIHGNVDNRLFRDGLSGGDSTGVLTSTIGKDRAEASAPDAETNTQGYAYPRPALPPPLPPITRDPVSTHGTSLPGQSDVEPSKGGAPPTIQGPPRTPKVADAQGKASLHSRSPSPPVVWDSRRSSRSAERLQPPLQEEMIFPSSVDPHSPPRPSNNTAGDVEGTERSNHNSRTGNQPPLMNNASRSSRPPTTSTPHSLPKRRGDCRGEEQPANGPSNSSSRPSRHLSQPRQPNLTRRLSSADGRGAGEPGSQPERLMPMSLPSTQPLERFFVQYTERPANAQADADPQLMQGAEQPRDDHEMLLEQFADYTDDDSYFSSGVTVIESDPCRMRSNPLRARAVRSVHDTLRLRELTHGRMPEEIQSERSTETSWLYQIHHRALALEHSSFFFFPARWTPRVVVYNVLHHWLTELALLLLILSYAIFQASWGRYYVFRIRDTVRPDFMLFADVFYTFIFGVEIVARLFATGVCLHQRSFFRSPWHWLDMAVFVLMIMTCTNWPTMWNFTAWRLIRTIKCFTYVQFSLKMKLLAKALLRSTNKTIQVTIFLLYFIFFFGLLGLQLFVGKLHSRCVNDSTGAATTQVCRPTATGQYGIYWGHRCPFNHHCVSDAFPNPHFDFRSFDDVGHAMLSTFHIMTYQGWTSLMNDTSDAVTLLAFLYYAFTILLCTWVVSPLYIGVFIEKRAKTEDFFKVKYITLFGNMLLEQRRRMNAAVRISDYVERDENGCITHYPHYKTVDVCGDSNSTNSQHGKAEKHTRSIRSTNWTDAQRVQLHLSLTRQRDVAEQAERRRRTSSRNGVLDVLPTAATTGSNSSRQIGPSTGKRPDSAGGGEGVNNFALGGRVGAVQHHPSSYNIGASRQSEMPFAVRQEFAAGELRFLDRYQTGVKPEEDASGNGNQQRGMSRDSSLTRPPRGHAANVLATRESAGVIPHQRAMSVAGNVPRTESKGSHWGNVSRVPSAAGVGSRPATPLIGIGDNRPMTAASQRPRPQEAVELMVHDPEGGDFAYADTCGQKWEIIRNMIHMFTEGYPRVLTQYLWEHTLVQYRYGLMPLHYTNKYEEKALRNLRSRRARERRQERGSVRSSAGVGLTDDDDDDSESEGVDNEKEWMREEGLTLGSMSPIRMARNIKENAPITPFNWFMLFLIFCNAVFNASRHDTMPEYWETGTFIAGVVFSALFLLELLVRLIALGPGPFIVDPFNVVDLVFNILSLFQLGFSRSNTISLFNWVRFLRLFRVMPYAPMRKVTRVLIAGSQDILYALVFFSMYMFMWLLLGMSFFGTRFGWINYDNSDYYTRGNFETFSMAAYAVAQSFSVNKDEWLYLSWSGMRVRGGYTVMYFICTVMTAYIFRYFFIATMMWSWQSEEERDDVAFQPGGGSRTVGSRLRWFDFTVWRSFKHIHGGFQRRDVAPDEVYYLNEDMRRQLRIAEATDRYYREHYERAKRGVDLTTSLLHDNQFGDDEMGPQYVSIGGQLYRQQDLPVGDHANGPPTHAPIPQFYVSNDVPNRFSRRYHAIPATAYDTTVLGNLPHKNHDDTDLLSSPVAVGDESMWDADDPSRAIEVAGRPLRSQRPSNGGDASLNPLVRGPNGGSSGRHAHSAHNAMQQSVGRVSLGVNESNHDPSVTVAAQLVKLGHERNVVAAPEKKKKKLRRGGQDDGSSGRDGDTGLSVESDAGISASGDEEYFEHQLLGGPRLRYRSVIDGGRRVFERCLDCNTHKQMPLRAAPTVEQRTADELHAEHCHMAAVRSSRQLVLNALLGYARLQADHEVHPTKETVETVLGQAWSCGMLLFDTIDNLSCADLPEEERTWSRLLEALELQQWLLGLHVGEEQVGRATLAYVLAHKHNQAASTHGAPFMRTLEDRSFFVLSSDNVVRRVTTSIVESWWFEAITLFIIFAASICLAIYHPEVGNRDMGDDHNSNKYKALHVLDDIFTVLFVVEMVLKWICMGVVFPLHRAYFWHRWNIFDFFIVVISIVSWASSNTFLRYLKVMRCFRILGPLRFLSWNRSMSSIAVTVWDSIPMLANVCLLMLMNYIVWAIIFCSMFMNKMNFCSNAAILNRTACVGGGHQWLVRERNFRNFYESLLTTVEISTGGEWLDVMYNAVDSWSTEYAPIRNRHPYLGLVFIAYYYVSHFVLFSLFMSAVIYCYMLAKNSAEGAAGITFEHQLWLRMQRMIMRIRPKVSLLPLGNSLSRVLHRVVTSKGCEIGMGLVLVCNMITMSLQWYRMSETQEKVLDILQWVFVAIFTLEVICRLIAHGPRFFSRWGQCWDLFVTCLSFLQIGLNTTRDHRVPFNVNVLRMLRVGRLLYLVEFVTPFKTYLPLFNEVLRASVPGIVNVTLIYMLAVYVFAILGLHFLGYVVPYGGYIDSKYNNFYSFVNALIMVFRLGTLENWATMLRGSLDRGDYCERGSRCGPTNWAPVYYIPLVICFFLLLSTLYMAVIVENYVTAVRMHASVSRMHDLRRFCQLWSKRDPNGMMVLPTAALPELLEELRPPLGLRSRYNRGEVLRLLREYNIPDHRGTVYYDEVLMPLARRVMAMAFNENKELSGDSYDVAWRLSERSLGSLPMLSGMVTKKRHPHIAGMPLTNATVAEHFAAAYVQAAYRRDRAIRSYIIARSAVWKQGRAMCDDLALPYGQYGFGRVSLADSDPRDECALRGFALPDDARPNAPGPLYRRAHTQQQTTQKLEEREPATLLPAMYRTAIEEPHRRFGPDAPGAVRRHEKRSDKLRRRREEEELERLMQLKGKGNNSQLKERSISPMEANPHNSSIAPSATRRNPCQYNTDPEDPSYQPPLGTDPETMRAVELSRRCPPAGAGNASTHSLDDEYSPSHT